MKRVGTVLATFSIILFAASAFAIDTVTVAKQTQDYLMWVLVEQKPAVSYLEYKAIKKEWKEFSEKSSRSKEDWDNMYKELRRIDPELKTLSGKGDYDNAEKQLREFNKNNVPFEEIVPFLGPQSGAGSGFFINREGMFITNNHVAGVPNASIYVQFKGKHYKAKLLGKDPFSDLALLRVEGISPDVYSPVVLGDSDTLSVGEDVVIAGNPRSLMGSISAGVVSGLNRSLSAALGASSWPGMIQTDASVDHGNSGGPMIQKSTGDVVGVVDSTMVSFGFAIPSNVVKRFIGNIIQFGRPRWGMLGAKLSEIPVTDIGKKTAEEEGISVPGVETGAIVREVLPGTPASAGGLKPGDVIIKIGNQNIQNVGSVLLAVALSEPGKIGKLTVVRDNKELVLYVIWGERPEKF